MAAPLNASWNRHGGIINLKAATTLTTSATIEANGTFQNVSMFPEAAGGTITMMSGGLMSINAPVSATVLSTFGYSYESPGGVVSLSSGGGIDVSANIDVRGALHPSGWTTSTFSAAAAGDFRQLSGSVLAGSLPTHLGRGGTVTISSQGNVLLQGATNIDAWPDICCCDDDGHRGTITVTATGMVDVSRRSGGRKSR